MTLLDAHAETSDIGNWQRTVGEWRLEFNQEQAALTCTHAATGAMLSGTLRFCEKTDDGQTAACRVARPLDSMKERLAIIDSEGSVQAYIVFSGSGDALEIAAIHRAAQSFAGLLTFEAGARVGAQTFACRTRPIADSRVVQMASGCADSSLNDSLFDLATDTALHFTGNSVSIASTLQPNGDPEFHTTLTASIAEATRSVIGINLMRDYYRTRYVPRFRPIDKQRCPKAPTGWMSWNVYFDTAGEKENLDEARSAAQLLKPYGLDIFSIESWQDNSPTLPVSKFHNLTLRADPKKFPSGMKWLAGRIRELGFKPGIWTVPFGTGDGAFYQEHKDWFLHDAQGNPMQNWCGLYVLDPSQEAVRNHMEETHRVMSQDWGYEYFKIDGMSGRGPGYSAHFYERPEVRAAFKEPCEDPFRLCVEALRRGIGPDRIWLACQGHYTGPEIGLADAGRIGADIVSQFRAPDWNNYSHQARATLNQLFVNNIAWYNDPDTLLVGAANPMETVRLAATVVALTGQTMFAGDKLAELPAARMRLLQQSLPVCDVRPLDLFPIFELLPVWVLKVRTSLGTWDIVSLFNWNDAATDISAGIAEIGLYPGKPYWAYDCWNRVLHCGLRDQLVASVPPHGNALFSLRADEGHPQLVFSDRHLTQGVIGMEALAWDASARTLSGTIDLVGNDATELVIAVPEGFALASATTDAGVTQNTAANSDGSLTLTLKRETPGASSAPASWKLQF